MRGRRASAIVAHGLAAGATAWERTFHFKRPPGDWQAAFENVRDRLISNPPAPAAPLDELALSLTETAAESGYQVDMLDAKRADKRRRLADAARHISPAGCGGSHSQSVPNRAMASHPGNARRQKRR